MAPWELAERPVAWQRWALAAEAAEQAAEEAARRRAERRARA